MNRESINISCTRRLRESGVSINLADQSVSSLMDVVKSNVYTLICLGQSSSKDMREIIEILGLNKEQAQIINKLDPGQGIIKLASRFPYPVLVRFPFVEPIFIDENEIDEINSKDPVIKSLLENVRHIKDPVKNIDRNEVGDKSIPQKDIKSQGAENKNAFSENIMRYIMVVNLYQYKKTKIEMSDLAGFSRGTGSRVQNQCLSHNLIKNIELSFGRGKPQYPKLLPDAYEVLGIKEKKYFGKGAGDEHILCQHLVAENFKAFNPTIELYRGKKHMDVAFEINDSLIAIEVEMTSVHMATNVKKNIEDAKATCVIVACKNTKILQEVQTKLIELPPQLRNKTETILLSKLLSSDPKDIIGCISKHLNSM